MTSRDSAYWFALDIRLGGEILAGLLLACDFGDEVRAEQHVEVVLRDNGSTLQPDGEMRREACSCSWSCLGCGDWLHPQQHASYLY